jgi:hypothetical protein
MMQRRHCRSAKIRLVPSLPCWPARHLQADVLHRLDRREPIQSGRSAAADIQPGLALSSKPSIVRSAPENLTKPYLVSVLASHRRLTLPTWSAPALAIIVCRLSDARLTLTHLLSVGVNLEDERASSMGSGNKDALRNEALQDTKKRLLPIHANLSKVSPLDRFQIHTDGCRPSTSCRGSLHVDSTLGVALRSTRSIKFPSSLCSPALTAREPCCCAWLRTLRRPPFTTLELHVLHREVDKLRFAYVWALIAKC